MAGKQQRDRGEQSFSVALQPPLGAVACGERKLSSNSPIAEECCPAVATGIVLRRRADRVVAPPAIAVRCDPVELRKTGSERRIAAPACEIEPFEREERVSTGASADDGHRHPDRSGAR